MAISPCKECGKDISDKAIACPHCGFQVSKEGMGCGSIIGIALLAAFLIPALMPASKQEAGATNTPSTPVHSKEAEARGACILFIKKKLDDPDNAQFAPSKYVYVNEQKTGQWRVQFPVRAKNTYNALVSTVYECELIESGDKWLNVSVKDMGIKVDF